MTIDAEQKIQILKGQTNAVEAGAEAFKLGLLLNANPYVAAHDKSRLPLRKAWEFGWEQANLLRNIYGI